MAGRKLRTRWSKEPDEEPDYSDWKITLAIKKIDDPTQSSHSKTDRKESVSSPLSLSSSSSSSSSSSVTFSVHRNILGPQSEYFNRIFKSNDNDGFSEAHQQHSHIDFLSTISVKVFGAIIEAFEGLLDYCYLEKVDFSFKGASPVGLLYFCDYFQMEDDFEFKVDEYSRKHFIEMTYTKKLHLLYEEIIDFRTAGLNVGRAITITAESCYNYDTYGLLSDGTPLAIIADLPLWLNIVSFIQIYGYDTEPWKKYRTKSQSVNLSMNIANFLENNDNVDSDSFEKLTNEKILPYVEANAALVLLKKEQKYATLDVHICDNDDEDENNKETLSSELTDLQNRCLESLVEARLELSRNKELRDRAMRVMTLFPRVMSIYLNKTLNSYGVEKVMREQQFDRLVQENVKRRKLKQDSTVRLRNVEQELKTEKEKNRLLLAERVNDRTPKTNYGLSSAQRQRIEYQYQQQRPWKYNERTGRVQRNKP